MDARLFSLPTQPNLYPKQTVDKKRVLAKPVTLPTPDSRFPGWAAVNMEDGRFATDWRPHCCYNIPTGSQFATRQWMQRNSDAIIDVSRQRLAESIGVVGGFDNTVVPPPVATVSCDSEKCSTTPTGLPYGIGVERQEIVPDLFGTFAAANQTAPQTLPAITSRFEGGRNTPRGRQFHALGTGSLTHM